MADFRQIVAQLEDRGQIPNRPRDLNLTRDAFTTAGLLDRVNPNRVVVVAGTNGKGSTCAILERLLRDAGMTTGLYTSPHLMKITERIRLNGQEIAETEFCRLYEQLKDIADQHDLTHFEMLTLMALQSFNDHKVDWIILEVGLGGIWDSTNAVPHHYCVIAPIDFDHTNILGTTLPDIARNKFGIVQQNCHVAYAPLPDDLTALRRDTESKTNSTWYKRGDFGFAVEDQGTQNPKFFLTWPKEGGQRVPLTLPGMRGAENAALALTAFDMMGFDSQKHLAAVSDVAWPGRMERLDLPDWPCPVFLSGDHNLHGVHSLLDLLQYYDWNTLHIMAGIGQNKDVGPLLEKLVSIERSKLYLTQTTFKARALNEYGTWPSRAADVDKDPLKLFNRIRDKAKPGDMVIVTGSLYLVGDLRALLLGAGQGK